MKKEKHNIEEESVDKDRTIQQKNKEIETIITKHLKEVSDLRIYQTENGDFNMKRLKKMYSDLKT